jgi:ferredoxin--NADP+ reductase
MTKVIDRKQLVPNIHLLQLESSIVAEKIMPGQFVIVKIDEKGERIPLSVADWDSKTGVISIVFMEVGTTTSKLAKLTANDEIESFAGPLGKPIEIDKYGTVICAGGCYGIGAIYPIAYALKEKGNKVISIIEARSKYLLYWLDKLEKVSDYLICVTRDGSYGIKGHIRNGLEYVIGKEKIDRVFTIGCTFMMMLTAETTKPYNIKTIASLNSIMIDGTGMCGVCRVSVDGKSKFACVDGPHFDAHQVDWDILISRRTQYLEEESQSLSYKLHHP